MVLLSRVFVEKIFPSFISRKIVFVVKTYRYYKSVFLKTALPALMPRYYALQKKNRNKKRSSYNNGEPFPKAIHSFGAEFQIVLDPLRNGLIDEYIADHGVWEEDLGRALVPYLKEGAVFLDIGANIGYHSLFAASLVGKSGKVYSFEPIPRLAKQIEKSQTVSKFDNIKVCNFGLSDKEAEQIIYLKDENIGGSSLTIVSASQEFNTSEKIILKTLDGFLDPLIKVDAIKIDVEGYEYEALKGAVEVIERNRPTIFMEFSPMFYIREDKNKPHEIISFLESLGYSFFDLKDKPYDLRKWLKDPYNIYTQTDIICKII